MSTQISKTIAKRFLIETFSQGKTQVLDEIMDAAYIDHDAPPGMPPGREGVKFIQGLFRSAFPDLQFSIDDQVAEADRVVTRWTFHGTQQGELYGIPATQRRVEMRGVSIYRIADGKMLEGWVSYDMLGMMQQLGVVPVPGQ